MFGNTIAHAEIAAMGANTGKLGGKALLKSYKRGTSGLNGAWNANTPLARVLRL